MSKLENNKIIEKAIILIQNSKFLDAINILEKNIKENKLDFKSFYLLGTLYLQTKKLDLAESNLRIAISLNEDLFEALHNLGIVLSQKKNFSDARDIFLKVLIKKPNNIQTLIELGRNYELSNELKEARMYYKKVLELDKSNKIANNLIGNMLLNEGLHKEALNYLKKSTGLIRFNEENFEIIK